MAAGLGKNQFLSDAPDLYDMLTKYYAIIFNGFCTVANNISAADNDADADGHG